MLAGIMAGAICNVALYFQYYRFAPSEFVLGWPYLIQAAILPRWMPEAVTIFCVITIFSFGWIAARWSWARTWQSSILAGAGSGTIAGCMVYAIVGLFWFGIKGQADVLGNFYNSMAEIDGLLIIVEAIFRTGTFVYAYFIQFVPACIALGTLGGLTSALLDANDVWGKHPNHSHGWLFRLPAYLLVICGILNLIVTVAILSLLWDKTMSSVKELAAENMRSELGTGYGFFLHWGYLTGLVFTFLPAGLTWGWIIRAWRHHGKLNFFSVIWLISTIVGAGYYMFKTTGLVDLMLGTEMLPFALIMPLILIMALTLGFLAGVMAEPLTDADPHHSLSDKLAFIVSYGILGGTQIIMGAPAMAIPIVLITVTNIPHLVSAEIVNRSPVEQVTQLFNFQIYAFIVALVLCGLIGLVAPGLVSFIRRIFKIHEEQPANSQL